MKSVRGRRPSTGTAISMLALSISIVGTSHALPGRGKIDRNDLRRGVVKTQNLKKGAVKTLKIAPSAVKGSRIANGTIRAADIGAGGVGQSELAGNSVGADELKTVQTTENAEAVDSGDPVQVTATCPGNRQIVSGGFSWDANTFGLYVTAVQLDPGGNGVTVRAYNGSGTDNRTLTAQAHCIAR